MSDRRAWFWSWCMRTQSKKEIGAYLDKLPVIWFSCSVTFSPIIFLCIHLQLFFRINQFKDVVVKYLKTKISFGIYWRIISKDLSAFAGLSFVCFLSCCLTVLHKMHSDKFKRTYFVSFWAIFLLVTKCFTHILIVLYVQLY